MIRFPYFVILVLAAGLLRAQAPAGDSNHRDALSKVSDGMADASDTIQKLIDSGDPNIHFPRGTYRLTQSVLVDLDKTGFVSLSGDGVARIVMDGPGPAFRLIGTHDSSADPGTFKDNVWQRQRAPMLDGLEIIGNHPKACGVEAVGTMQLTLTRLVVRKVLHAVHLVKRNRNVLIANSHLYENRGIGIFLDNVDLHQINVNACHISYNDQGGIVSRQGNVRNLHITGCDIESNMSPETAATANVLIDCRGSANGTAEVAITGCTIQHNSKSPDSANVRVIGNSDANDKGVAAQWGHVTITGNVFSDVQVNVHLQNCRGVAIAGNTFWMGYGHNLLVENSRSVVLGANNFDRNPGYAYGTALQTHDAIAFRNCEDCTLTGLHLTGVHAEPAALLIEDCRRFNVASCTILDSDGPGLWLRNVSDSLVTGCLIRDDRPAQENAESIRVEGGANNTIVNNAIARP
ncbi:MAG: right-handed parallel beta-helix repeat-containing protein [Planctomycetaceae bacterium]